MENYNYTTSGGVSFCGLLGIVFIVLKLCNVINWSWLWVLSPFWIPFAIVLGILGIGIVGFGIYKLGSFIVKKTSKKKGA